MFKLFIAASGSKANATLVIHGDKALLIDCGTTYKALCGALCAAGLDVSDIAAVLVTHNHSDHVKGLETLSKKINAPFYSCSDIAHCSPLPCDTEICGMKICHFDCSHDVDCVGYKISADGKTVAIATDTGVVTEAMLENMSGCDTVMLECNHDPEMLKNGPYPYQLKQRISSPYGHLSNTDCAKTLVHLATLGTKTAVLAHMSETNNTPLLARHAVKTELEKYGLEKNINVYCADNLTEIEI